VVSSSFGTADDGDSGAREGGGPFHFSKKRAVKSTKVNMAEGPSTATTPSNQFIVKYSVHGHHMYKRRWSPCVGELFVLVSCLCWYVSHLRHFASRTMSMTRCRGCTSEQLFNCSLTHPEGNNTHLPLLHQEAEDEQHSSLWRCRSTMPADVLPPRHQGVGES